MRNALHFNDDQKRIAAERVALRELLDTFRDKPECELEKSEIDRDTQFRIGRWITSALTSSRRDH